MAVDQKTSLGPFIGANDEDLLEVDGCDAHALVTQFGSPLWVISENTVRQNYRELRDAFTRVYPRTQVVYASKANPEPALIQIALSEGALVDVVTLGHIALVGVAGCPPEAIVFNGNAKTVPELRWAIEHGVYTINVDSLEEMELLARMQPREAEPLPVCLRLALDEARFVVDDPEFAAQWSGSKFGMDPEDAFAAAAIASEHDGLVFAGVHHHFGWPAYGIPYSVELDLERHERSVEQVIDFVLRLRETSGLAPKILNFGGGFRRVRPEGFGPSPIANGPTAEAYAQAVAGKVGELVERHKLGSPSLLIEPGGYLVADAAVLLCSVGLRKSRRRAGSEERRWVFVENTSAYHFVRRLMFAFEHHVVVASHLNEPESEIVSLAGPICAGDEIAIDVRLPRISRGDIIAVLDQGAYCESVTSDYCAVPIPAVALACSGRAEIVRRRETVEDIVGRFRLPSWLTGYDRASSRGARVGASDPV